MSRDCEIVKHHGENRIHPFGIQKCLSGFHFAYVAHTQCWECTANKMRKDVCFHLSGEADATHGAWFLSQEMLDKEQIK